MIDKVAQVRVEPARGRQLDLTVLIPTRNEADNIAQVLAGLSTTGQSFDVLFVDDSDDDTPQVIQNCAAASPLRVGIRHRPAGERAGGLGGAVLAGLGSVSTAWVVVMDHQ